MFYSYLELNIWIGVWRFINNSPFLFHRNNNIIIFLTSDGSSSKGKALSWRVNVHSICVRVKEQMDFVFFPPTKFITNTFIHRLQVIIEVHNWSRVCTNLSFHVFTVHTVVYKGHAPCNCNSIILWNLSYYIPSWL